MSPGEEAERVALMVALADAINAELNGDARPLRKGFALLVFDFDTIEGTLQYISNGQPANIVAAMREIIERIESTFTQTKGTLQ